MQTGLLRPIAAFSHEPPLTSQRIYLRPPSMADFMAWRNLRAASRDFLAPWEPAWPPNDLSRLAYRRRIRRYASEMREERGYAFFLFLHQSDALIGGLTLSNVRRGVTQACVLGYWMGAAYAGQGYMGEAVETITEHVFGRLRLHRLEAACLLSNERSIRLLRGAGFTCEGVARRLLCIDGEWQDHLLFARLYDDPPVIERRPTR